MRLQLYEDGTVGYLGIDGDEKANFNTGSPVVCTQGETENRDDFINKNNIKLKTSMYGSNENLDKQVNDESQSVRFAVAIQQGYGLDKLINDEDEEVRVAVARQGYRLDKLINDEDFHVREAVAGQGYGLDILVNDEYYAVRAAVAKQGYGLNILVNDEYYNVRVEVAKHGYGLDRLINDKEWRVREEVAKHGYGLDKLIYDSSYMVRAAVAEQGYGLDKLIYSKSEYVRATVARQGYGLDILINDKHYEVRRAVAKQGYELHKLVNDKNQNVRAAVAEQGYRLDKLINDRVEYVRDTVENYLKEHNLTLNEWKKQHNIKDDDTTEVVKDFIYKVDDSKKLEVHTEYDDIEEFFNEPIANDIKLDTISICAVDTKEPLIKLEKVDNKGVTGYKFLVDMTNENGDDYIVRSIITTKEKLEQLLNLTIDSLKNYPQFSKYADDLENCL